ncbi:MAG: FtsW/RodA/SpoVE family cell cycle protein [Oscillospiraceae bacterium]|nr:FtsW/RodA/SpoVE family cell cycle protein [Oscillospiraceae bacterium]
MSTGIYIWDFAAGFSGDYITVVTTISRFILPVLALIIAVRCVKSLFREKSEGEIWAQLQTDSGNLFDLKYWENTIGRSKDSDVFIEFPTISRNHAALVRDNKGNWRIYDIDSKTGVTVNKKKIDGGGGICVKTGDIIEIGGVSLTFIAADKTDEYEQAASRTRPGKVSKQHITLIYLTSFQVILALQLYITENNTLPMIAVMCFLALIILMWGCYFITIALRRVAFEVETLGFFLTSVGLAVVASSEPSKLPRHIIYIAAGLILFYAFGWFLRDLDRAKKMRRPLMVIGPLLLAVTLAIGLITNQRTNGAIRWIYIGSFSVQPAEFVKVALIFAGAATLERLFARRNLIGFLAMTGVCLGLLAVMTDFGNALIFFVAYLVIAFMRSGDFATVFLSIAGAGFAGLVALSSRPHIASRFASWSKAWDHIYTAGGYQQTRAMSAAASGGLFGVGAGNGWFKRITAADSDLVFGMVSEELGLIVALTLIAAIIIFAVYSVYASAGARSSFFAIAACAASAIFVFQMMLNVLGSMDILPFTGVTFPFVSNGGTSLVACWGMLAFFKAVDTRQNASFAVKMPERPTRGGGGAIKYRMQDQPQSPERIGQINNHEHHIARQELGISNEAVTQKPRMMESDGANV